MASILGNFLLGIADDISESIAESRREQREENYQWACRRTDEARQEYALHANRANAWLDELERAQAEFERLRAKLDTGRYTSWEASEYNCLRNKIRRIQGYIQDERREARSAQRSYQMRQEVEIKRANRCGDTSFGFDLF
jgi:hypothetical protein